jgi:hypothetical protein
MRLEHAQALLTRAREFLRERHILFPADSALLRVVAKQKKLAREHIVTRLAGTLPPAVTKALCDLLDVKEGETVSALQRIKANPAKPSANAMRALCDKLAAIEATGVLGLDLSWLNGNYQRSLFHYVRVCTADRLRDLTRSRRLAALVCFLRQSYRDAVDQAVDMFDKLLTRTHTQAEKDLDDLAAGHATASVALKRLASCTSKNHFYRANRDLGRVFKTEFLLSYLSEPQLRARVRRGLLKVEQLHALARDVYYGRRGKINARELHEQMNSCSNLTLILACVIYWQAKEISRVVRCCNPENDQIDVSMLEHVSPIEWDNVILYGQYILDPGRIR